MSTHIFILGKDAALSLAELEAVYGKKPVFAVGDSFARLDLKKDLTQADFDRLGGQVKAGKVAAVLKKGGLVQGLAEILAEGHYSGKLNYGLSVYGWPERNLRSLLLDLKKEFKRRGISSRFANQAFLNISTAQSKGLSGGQELLICKSGEEFLVGRVVAVQDIDAYSQRDYKKPFRDMKVGMLPPKLAQILINLTGASGRIWDPFCGGGVLIMEGLLMGHEMLGSDINEKTLAGAQRNVQWLKKAFGARSEAKLFVHDARKVLSGEKYDAIAFEGYLGPPQDRLKKKSELISVTDELTPLYLDFFKAIQGFKGPVVAALPFYKTKEGDLSLEKALKGIEKLGFKTDLHLKYARADQLVGREVFRFLTS
ncbi:MAG: hypothetical protein OEY44_00785 [Candidatus Peregrinibacteria bacterium]|nr:hypothetical protein [Candidatus Peregrinibacteria bacterium]